MAAHLQEPAIIGPLAADKDRVHRSFHVVVDAARAGALEERKALVVRVKHHLLRLARVGAGEQHPAVAQPQVRDFHRDRRAVDQHDLMAPVEPVRLARRKAQRHERIRRRGRPLAPPRPGIPPDRVVAALVAKPAQRLEQPDQRQPLAAGLGLVGLKQLVQPLPPCAKARHRLLLALVLEVRRLRPDHLTHGLARYPQLAADRLDRFALHEMGPTDPRNRLHNKHPKPALDHYESHSEPHRQRGPVWAHPQT